MKYFSQYSIIFIFFSIIPFFKKSICPAQSKARLIHRVSMTLYISSAGVHQIHRRHLLSCSGIRRLNKLLCEVQQIDMRRIIHIEEPFMSFSAFAVIEQEQRQRQNHKALEIILQQ